jgi:hypothetical protein
MKDEEQKLLRYIELAKELKSIVEGVDKTADKLPDETQKKLLDLKDILKECSIVNLRTIKWQGLI